MHYTTYEEIPAKGHGWNNAEYEWSAQNTSVTATRICENDISHTETETADVTAAIVSPTAVNKGSVTYTSDEFENEGFAAQTKTIDIPALNNMTVLRLPGMINVIEDEAFENLACEAIIIPDGCISIGSHAFYNCRNLKYIRVPADTEIASDAFEGCESVVIDRVTE